MPDGLYIGLMSGTSVDAIDAALVRCAQDGIELLATHSHAIPAATRRRIEALSHPGDNEIERLGPLDRELGRLFAEAALALAGSAGAEPAGISAIGSHGQTVRHRPPSGGAAAADSFTLQLGDPNTIAEITGITTVADFRRRDVAAGGEGAPLAPAFHAAAFSTETANRAIVNIGGIANISILRRRELLLGFDCGPGNTLMDHWMQRHHGAPYDREGDWASQGRVAEALLERLLGHPFLALDGPRSSGKEAFNLAWLDGELKSFPQLQPVDIQATLAQLTAACIARGIETAPAAIDEVYVCGGGAHNIHLMDRLRPLVAPARLATTTVLGLDPDWIEAITFAWLARRTLAGLSGNAPAVTGACGERVLGAVYSAR